MDANIIEIRRFDELCDRVRYRRIRFFADRALLELGATSKQTAVRRSAVGIAGGPLLLWLKLRGIVVQTGSGRIWVNAERREQLAGGMAMRIAAYLALASLFSGAAIAVTAATV
jgi:hypothetical protein